MKVLFSLLGLCWTGLARLARLLFGLESQSSRPSGTLSQSVRGTFSLTSAPPLAVVERQSSGGREDVSQCVQSLVSAAL